MFQLVLCIVTASYRCLTTRTALTFTVRIVKQHWFQFAQYIGSLGTRAVDSSCCDVTYRAGAAACPGQGPRGCLHGSLCNLFHSYKCFSFATLSLMIHHPGVYLRRHSGLLRSLLVFFFSIVSTLVIATVIFLFLFTFLLRLKILLIPSCFIFLFFFLISVYVQCWAGLAQSVQRRATGQTVWGSNTVGGEIIRTRPDHPWGPPSLLYNAYRVILEDKVAGTWCCLATSSAQVTKKSRAIQHLLPPPPRGAFVSCYRVGVHLPLPCTYNIILFQ